MNVDAQPIDAKLASRLEKERKIHGLAHETVRPEVVTSQHIVFLPAGGQDDDRNSAGPLVGAHAPQHVETIELGKVQIEQNDLRCTLWLARDKGALGKR